MNLSKGDPRPPGRGSRILAVTLTDTRNRQTNQRTVGLWLLASFPALILVLSFIPFSFLFGQFDTFGA